MFRWTLIVVTIGLSLLIKNPMTMDGTFYLSKEHFIDNRPISKWASMFVSGYQLVQKAEPNGHHIRLLYVPLGGNFLSSQRNKYIGSVYYEDKVDNVTVLDLYVRNMYAPDARGMLSRFLEMVLEQYTGRMIVVRTLGHDRLIDLLLDRGFTTNTTGPNAYREFVRM